ncbi:MAG: hypothetical protein ACM67R_01925 [Clostridiales bacterium]|jgi:hypothetical protein|nr:unknown [Clostridium sp. CAG:567]
MKSEQGVTLTSLVIYIAVATVLISTMAVMSSHFFANIQLVKNQSDYVVEYNKFNMFFIQDVKANKAASIIGTTIVFEDGTKYEYKDESIYRNDKKIAKNIRTASFEPATYTVNNVTKNLIKVNLNIGVEKKSYQKQIEYVLKYW